MTTLQIVPNFKSKTAKVKGAAAAGEHVRVEIANDGEYVASTESLRLRVVDEFGRTLAQFPPPAPEAPEEEVEPVEDGEEEILPSVAETPAWDEDITPLSCELNLNTVQMLRAVPPNGTRRLFFVLDDFEAKTLYFKDECDFSYWPRRRGEEEPLDLDGWRDFLGEAREAMDEAAADSRQAASDASMSAASAASAEERATAAETAALAAQSSAALSNQSAAASAASAGVYAERAASSAADARSAADSIIPPDDSIDPDSPRPVKNSAIAEVLDGKVDKEAGKGLSSNDFSDSEKTLLANLAESVPAAITELADVKENTYRKDETYPTSVIDAIEQRLIAAENKIPDAASSGNQLADKRHVADSIAATQTRILATWFSSGVGEEEPLSWAAFEEMLAEEYSSGARYGDMAIWRGDSGMDGNMTMRHYRFDGETWELAYETADNYLTQAQWSALNSGASYSDFNAKRNYYDLSLTYPDGRPTTGNFGVNSWTVSDGSTTLDFNWSSLFDRWRADDPADYITGEYDIENAKWVFTLVSSTLNTSLEFEHQTESFTPLILEGENDDQLVISCDAVNPPSGRNDSLATASELEQKRDKDDLSYSRAVPRPTTGNFGVDTWTLQNDEVGTLTANWDNANNRWNLVGVGYIYGYYYNGWNFYLMKYNSAIGSVWWGFSGQDIPVVQSKDANDGKIYEISASPSTMPMVTETLVTDSQISGLSAKRNYFDRSYSSGERQPRPTTGNFGVAAWRGDMGSFHTKLEFVYNQSTNYWEVANGSYYGYISGVYDSQTGAWTFAYWIQNSSLQYEKFLEWTYDSEEFYNVSLDHNNNPFSFSWVPDGDYLALKSEVDAATTAVATAASTANTTANNALTAANTANTELADKRNKTSLAYSGRDSAFPHSITCWKLEIRETEGADPVEVHYLKYRPSDVGKTSGGIWLLDLTAPVNDTPGIISQTGYTGGPYLLRSSFRNRFGGDNNRFDGSTPLTWTYNNLIHTLTALPSETNTVLARLEDVDLKLQDYAKAAAKHYAVKAVTIEDGAGALEDRTFNTVALTDSAVALSLPDTTGQNATALDFALWLDCTGLVSGGSLSIALPQTGWRGDELPTPEAGKVYIVSFTWMGSVWLIHSQEAALQGGGE